MYHNQYHVSKSLYIQLNSLSLQKGGDYKFLESGSVLDSMNGYIADPWTKTKTKNEKGENIDKWGPYDMKQYEKDAKEYHDIEKEIDDDRKNVLAKFSDTKFLDNFVDKNLFAKLKKFNDDHNVAQGHAGNLKEHSQWSAMQVLKWYDDKKPIIEGVNKELAVVAAFTHDIGKAGNCKMHLYNNDKYIDTEYLQNGKYIKLIKPINDGIFKYESTYTKFEYKDPDRIHSEISALMISGLIRYCTKCDEEKQLECNVNKIPNDIKKMLKEANSKITDDEIATEIKQIAVAAAMHWDFGEISETNPYPACKKYYVKNPKINTEQKPENMYISKPYIDKLFTYIEIFKWWCDNLKVPESIQLETLKLCIIVSCADIKSSTNKYIADYKYQGESPLKEVYIGKDSWTIFNMEANYMRRLHDLISVFNIAQRGYKFNE